MRAGDGCLELVRADPPERGGSFEYAQALVDAVAVPERAVLVLEQDELPVGVDSRPPPRVLEEHEGEETERLGLVRHEDREQLGEADRLVAQVVAHVIGSRGGRVALVEHEVEDGEHRPQALREQVVGRDAERDPRRPDLALRTDEALRHRRLGDEEGAGDLGRRQSRRPRGA